MLVLSISQKEGKDEIVVDGESIVDAVQSGKFTKADTIVFTLVGRKERWIQLGITAPKSIRVDRKEVYDAIQREKEQSEMKTGDKSDEDLFHIATDELKSILLDSGKLDQRLNDVIETIDVLWKRSQQTQIRPVASEASLPE